jgi:hypothetical protein
MHVEVKKYVAFWMPARYFAISLHGKTVPHKREAVLSNNLSFPFRPARLPFLRKTQDLQENG